MYLKKTILPNTYKKWFPLSRFSGIDTQSRYTTLPIDYAKECINFSFTDGQLVSGLNVARLYVSENGADYYSDPAPKKLKRLFINNYQDFGELLSHVIGIAEDNELLVAILDTVAITWAITGRTVTIDNPHGVAYSYDKEDYYLMGIEAEKMVRIQNQLVKDCPSTTPLINLLCTHNKRLVAVSKDEPLRIKFSDDFNFNNWHNSLKEGGYIDIPSGCGFIRKLVSFQNHLYIFCDFGVYKLNTNGEQIDFSITKAFDATGIIDGDSVACSTNSIIFMASDGLYVFDGFSTKRIYDHAYGVFKAKKSGFTKAVCHAEKYYCIYKNKFEQDPEYPNETVSDCANTMLIADLKSTDLSIIRGANYLDIGVTKCDANNTVVLLLEGEFNRYVAEVTKERPTIYAKQFKKVWRTGEIDFDLAGQFKYIDEVEFKTDTAFFLDITADGKEHRLKITPDKPRLKNLALKAKEFAFSIICYEADPHISSANVCVTFVESEK